MGKKPSKAKRGSHLIAYPYRGETWFNSPDNGKNNDDFRWLYTTWTYGDYKEAPFLKELERRGYDLSTLKFSVRLKNEHSE